MGRVPSCQRPWGGGGAIHFFCLSNTVPALLLFVCLAVLGLSCSTWDLLLQRAGSAVALHRLGCPAACGIYVFGPGDLTRVPCTGRWTLNHWTRQVLGPSLEALQAEAAPGEMVCARSMHGVFQEQQGGQASGEEWARARVSDGVRETKAKGWQEEQVEARRPLPGSLTWSERQILERRIQLMFERQQLWLRACVPLVTGARMKGRGTYLACPISSNIWPPSTTNTLIIIMYISSNQYAQNCRSKGNLNTTTSFYTTTSF